MKSHPELRLVSSVYIFTEELVYLFKKTFFLMR